MWRVAHVFRGIISGLVAYILYKNPAAARHPVFSVIAWLIGAAASFAITMPVGAEPPWDNTQPDVSAISGGARR